MFKLRNGNVICWFPGFSNEVVEALHQIDDLTGVSIHEIKGFGRSRGKNAPIRIVDNTINYVPHVKIEIICHDKLVENIVSTIQKAAHTGIRSDGKIYISPIEEAIRISTNERGEKAV